MQVYPSGNYIPIVISSPNYTSLSSMTAIFLTICLMVVLQPSRYSIFHGRDTPYLTQFFMMELPPVSVSILKPLLGVIGTIPLKL